MEREPTNKEIKETNDYFKILILDLLRAWEMSQKDYDKLNADLSYNQTKWKHSDKL